jgi:hypothetical protein
MQPPTSSWPLACDLECDEPRRRHHNRSRLISMFVGRLMVAASAAAAQDGICRRRLQAMSGRPWRPKAKMDFAGFADQHRSGDPYRFYSSCE